MANESGKMSVAEGEMAMLRLFKLAKSHPELNEDEATQIRVAARQLFRKLIYDMNEEWGDSVSVWALVAAEAEHCLGIYRQLLEVIANRVGGLILDAPVVMDKATQTALPAYIDAGTCTGEDARAVHVESDDDDVIFVDDGEAWAESVFAAMDGVVEQAEAMNRGDNKGRGNSETGVEARGSSMVGETVRGTEVNVEACDNAGPCNDTRGSTGDAKRARDERNRRVEREDVKPRGRESNYGAARLAARQSNERDAASRNGFVGMVCWICRRQHPNHACPKFLELSKRERYRTVQEYNVCHNCLQSGHRSSNCRRRNGCFCDARKCQCGQNHRHNSTICAGRRPHY